MSFLTQFMNKSPMIQTTASPSISFSSLFGSNSNAITPQTAMRLTTVFACNRVIAETLSSIGLNTFRYTADGKVPATDFGLYNILKNQPNPHMTSVMWREMIVQDLNLKGNHYSQIIRNGAGEVTALYPLISDNMSVEVLKGGAIRFAYMMGSIKKTVPAREILHIIGLPSEDGVTGLSPIEYNRRAIQLGDTTQEFGINFFDRGANGSGVFMSPGELSAPAFDRLKTDINKNYTGMLNSSKPMLLESGLTYERMSIPNNEAQFLETRKYQKEEIASVFRVPMHMINSLENATFSNIEHQSLEFVQFTMLPWAKRIEQALTLKLLTDRQKAEYSIKFNFETLLRGDYDTRTKGYSTMQTMGNLTINEVRALENMNSIGPAGDKHYVQMNMTAIEDLNKESTNE